MVNPSKVRKTTQRTNRTTTNGKSRAADEPRPSPGFQSLGQEAAIKLLRAADRIRHHFTEVLKPHGISLQQYNVLRILRGAGRDGLPAMQVRERLIEKTPGTTRLLDTLAARELITRERCPEDRRVVHNRITRAGIALLAELDEPISQADEEAVAALAPRQQKTLVGLMQRLLELEP